MPVGWITGKVAHIRTANSERQQVSGSRPQARWVREHHSERDPTPYPIDGDGAQDSYRASDASDCELNGSAKQTIGSHRSTVSKDCCKWGKTNHEGSGVASEAIHWIEGPWYTAKVLRLASTS